MWVFSRPKQPECEGKEKEGGQSEGALQNSDKSISTKDLRLSGILTFGKLMDNSDVFVINQS